MTRTLSGRFAGWCLRLAAAFTAIAVSEKSPPRAVEYMLAWLMVGWGFMVMYPQDVLVGDIYRYLLVVMSEQAIGVTSFSIGAMRLAFLLINGRWKPSALFRFLGAMAGMIWWLVIGQLYLVGIIQGAKVFPMMAFFPIFIYFEGYSCFRCGQDARKNTITAGQVNESGQSAVAS